MTTEVVIPVNDIIIFMQENWNILNVPVPNIYAMNSGDAEIRQNLNTYDAMNITIGTPAEVEQPIGTWYYANLTWKIMIDLYTFDSRERLWRLKDEIKRICHRYLHDMDNFQRIQYKQFSEIIDSQSNIWHGKIDIELVSSAVQIRDLPEDLIG